MDEPVYKKPSGTLAALVWHEVRMRVRGGIIWGGLLGLYSAMIVASYAAVEEQIPQFEQLLEAYPQAILEAFGITSLATPEAYMGGQVFNWLAPLALSFFPILALAGAIAGAEERGTLDVLLGNPIPRWQLVVGGFLAVAISLLGVLAIVGILTWVPAALLGVELSAGRTIEAVLSLWPACMFFGGMALLCSAAFHRRALAVAVPGVLLFGMYLMNVISGLVEELESIKYLSVLYYYGAPIENGIDWAHFAGVAAAAVALMALAIPVFRRRDIYT